MCVAPILLQNLEPVYIFGKKKLLEIAIYMFCFPGGQMNLIFAISNDFKGSFIEI